VHQKKQRIESRLTHLQKDQAADKVRMCFGSRKLFEAQYHLEESGFQSQEEWLKEWREKRNSSFFLMGSKDETAKFWYTAPYQVKSQKLTFFNV